MKLINEKMKGYLNAVLIWDDKYLRILDNKASRLSSLEDLRALWEGFAEFCKGLGGSVQNLLSYIFHPKENFFN